MLLTELFPVTVHIHRLMQGRPVFFSPADRKSNLKSAINLFNKEELHNYKLRLECIFTVMIVCCQSTGSLLW